VTAASLSLLAACGEPPKAPWSGDGGDARGNTFVDTGDTGDAGDTGDTGVSPGDAGDDTDPKLTVPAYGSRIPANAPVDVEIHVSPGGADTPSGGSAAKPFKTLAFALTAARGSLSKGKATAIHLAPGVYHESISVNKWSNGAERETLLVIEGAKGAESILRPLTAGASQLHIEDKSSVIIRSLVFEQGGAKGAIATTQNIHGGAPSVKDRPTDWRIENVVVRDGKGAGLSLLHIEHITFRDSAIRDMDGKGCHFINRFGDVQNVTLENTNRKGIEGFSNAGFTLQGHYTRLRKLHVKGAHGGACLRQDHSGMNLIVEDSTFEDCNTGIFIETCPGPFAVLRNRIFNTSGYGIIVSSSKDVLLQGNHIRTTGSPAVLLLPRVRINAARCIPPNWGCDADDYDLASGDNSNLVPIRGLQVAAVDNTIDTSGQGLIYRVKGETDIVDQFLGDGSYLGFGNRYHAQGIAKGFVVTYNGGGQIPLDFTGWRQKIGGDASSSYSQSPSGTQSPAPKPAVSFASSTFLVPRGAGTYSLALHGNVALPADLHSTDKWLAVKQKDAASIEITAGENDTGIRRAASVILKLPDGHASTTIIQDGPAKPPTWPVPTKLRVVDVKATQATLALDMVGFPASFLLHGTNYRVAGQPWQLGPEVTGSSFSLTGLSPDTKYQWRVVSIFETGVSAFVDGPGFQTSK